MKPKPTQSPRHLAKLNAHVERVARICAIGDACCREIEALGRKPQGEGRPA